MPRFWTRQPDEKLVALAGNRAFHSLAPRELPEIAQFFDEIRLPAGSVLLREGRRNHTLFLLVEGSVQVSQGSSPTGLLNGGDFFGEESIENGRPARSGVVAVTQVRLLLAGDQQYRSIRARLALPAGPTADAMALRHGSGQRAHAPARSAG